MLVVDFEKIPTLDNANEARQQANSKVQLCDLTRSS